METKEITLLEMGKLGEIALEVEIEYEYVDEEPADAFNPGMPAYCSFASAHVIRMSSDQEIKRNDFFDILDKIAEEEVISNWETIQSKILGY